MTDARDEVKRMAEEAADRAFEKHVKGRLGGTEPDARDEALLRALIDAEVKADGGAGLTEDLWQQCLAFHERHGSPSIERAERRLSALRPLIEEIEATAYERARSDAEANVILDDLGQQDGSLVRDLLTAAHNAAIEAALREVNVAGDPETRRRIMDAIRALKR